MTYPRKWEKMNDYTDRLKVPGGWIVVTSDLGYEAKAIHQIFISDPGHTWKFKDQE